MDDVCQMVCCVVHLPAYISAVKQGNEVSSRLDTHGIDR